MGLIFTPNFFITSLGKKEDCVIDLFDQVPYTDDGFGKRFLMDQDHLKLIQVALKPGQAVPPHNTNGEVNILILKGELTIHLAGVEHLARQGMLIPVGYDTPMQIQNLSQIDATFLIIKTPPPSSKS
jgi:quercetin dioxygenase-like cupin family protein